MNIQVPGSVINWKRNLVVVWLSQLFSLAGFGLCMPFIPLFMKDVLQIHDNRLRGVYVAVFAFASMISLCIATLFWGRLADKFGRKIMLLRASYGAALLYPLLAFAPNVWMLFAIRFFCSFFSGTVNPAQTLLVSTTPPEKHGFVLGILSTSIWSGNMIGYFSGGIIVYHFGYTAAFLSCGILYLVGGLLVQFFVEENFFRPVPGSASTAGGAAAPKKRIFNFTVGIILISTLFMGISRRIDQPFIAMLIELVDPLQNAKLWTGYISAAAAAGGVIAGFVVGYLSDRFPPVKLMIPMIIALAVSEVLQAFSLNVVYLMIFRFIAYFTGGGLQPVLLMWLSKSTSPELKGTCFGWAASVNTFGGVISSSLSAILVYLAGVRGIFISSAVIALFMLPMLFISLYQPAVKSSATAQGRT